MPQRIARRGSEPPVLMVKWYDVRKWLLDRVESFPKNQRSIFGQRIADRTPSILEVLVEAAYSPRKGDLLARANRDLAVLRWLVRRATDRQVIAPKQYECACGVDSVTSLVVRLPSHPHPLHLQRARGLGILQGGTCPRPTGAPVH
jgi:hypothetical protein